MGQNLRQWEPKNHTNVVTCERKTKEKKELKGADYEKD